MPRKKISVSFVVLLFTAFAIHIFSRSDRAVIEQYYSEGIYPYISRFLTFCFGWLPFSFGDLLYGIFFLWLAIKLFAFVRILFKRKLTKDIFFEKIRKLAVVLLSIYIAFNLLWGLNYNRLSVADKLGFKDLKYSVAELKEIDSVLVNKVNESKRVISASGKQIISSREVFTKSVQAYSVVKDEYPFLQYHTVSLKKSMWGWLGNYLGFTGYYNPITGEAQVNTTVPLFLQPFTTCHEIGHQLGYAKENEANFAGYLAASKLPDTTFHYSVYLDLFLYANRNLYTLDSNAASSFAKQLSPGVKEDLEELRKFYLRHKNPAEPVIRWLYGKYLQGNQQPEGMLAYDKVTALLIAHYKKFGRI